MKHLSIDELLEHRDGEAPTWVGGHVADCASCKACVEELSQVQSCLKELDEISPRRDLWPEIAESASRRDRKPVRAWMVAAVAMLVVAVVTVVFWSVALDGSAPRNTGLTTVQYQELDRAIGDLVTASNNMEILLHEYAYNPRVFEARDVVRIADLEDRIAMIDAQLASVAGPSSVETEALLWVDRVELLDALIEIHTSTADNPAIRYANLE
jgi:predicted anti-sigma-YlaC factor YlaD